MEDHPSAEYMLALIAPLLLLIIDSVILPEILKLFSKWEGHFSSAKLDASLFIKLGVFMVNENAHYL